MRPLISVIIPVYNSSETISDCLHSVISQKDVSLEIIIIDDGSTDDLKQVLGALSPPNLKYYWQENKGPAAARNKGIGLAKGEYIAFLDADDLWLPGKLSRQLDDFVDHPNACLSFTDMTHVEDGVKIFDSYLQGMKFKFVGEGHIYSQLLNECFIFTPTVMVRKNVFENVELFDERLKVAEDYDLWLRLSKNIEVKFLDTPFVIRHRNSKNTTLDTLKFIDGNLDMFQKHLDLNHGDKFIKKTISRRMGEYYFNKAYFYWKNDDLSKGREQILSCIKSRVRLRYIKLFILIHIACLLSILKA